MNKKDKVAAGLLAIFLGFVGAHFFYLRKTGLGILFLLLTIFFCWTGFVPGILGLIGIIQGIIYLCTDDKTFDKEYNK